MARKFIWDTDCYGMAYNNRDGYRKGDVWTVGKDIDAHNADLAAATGRGHYSDEKPHPFGCFVPNPKYAHVLKEQSERMRASAASAVPE
jgi:hypothetical protein